METLRIEGLTKKFGGVEVLKDVSFSVEPGERLLIIGPNGAGKTTLFNLIGGQLPPTSGKIYYLGEDITNKRAHQRAHMGIVRSFQLCTLFTNLSVMKNALLTFYGTERERFDLFNNCFAHQPVLGRVEAALQMADLWDKREEPIRLLAYGDQRRLEVVLSMISKPRLLLLDEPSNGLTTEESAGVIQLIRKLGKEVTVLIVAHDMDFVFEVAERINVLYYGGLLASGTPDEIRNNPQVGEIYMGLGEGANA